jgi:membrane protein YdbS with pleckstrin-like domain
MLDDDVRLDARRHGIVLARPLLRALALAGLGGAGFLGPWPLPAAGAAALAAAALLALAAVLRWDRTHVVLTSDTLLVVHGILRREQASVRLARVGAVEVEQSLLGRLLGYGTVVAGDLEISCVPEPRELLGILNRALTGV